MNKIFYDRLERILLINVIYIIDFLKISNEDEEKLYEIVTDTRILLNDYYLKKSFVFLDDAKTYQKLVNFLVIIEDCDQAISNSLINFKFDRIHKIDLAILRFASFELLENVQDKSVVINEAIMNSRLMSYSEKSYQFINGVCNDMIKKLRR